MKLTLRTPVIELHEYEIARLSASMSRKLAIALANQAAKGDASAVMVDDLLNYFPMRYEDRSRFISIDQLENGMEAAVEIYTKVSGGFRVGKNRGPRQPPLFIFEISGADAVVVDAHARGLGIRVKYHVQLFNILLRIDRLAFRTTANRR